MAGNCVECRDVYTGQTALWLLISVNMSLQKGCVFHLTLCVYGLGVLQGSQYLVMYACNHRSVMARHRPSHRKAQPYIMHVYVRTSLLGIESNHFPLCEFKD
eukprot:6492381-Amphidinium_carterae.2